MEEKTNATWLPNPEMERFPIVEKCDGCNKIFEGHAIPTSMILVDVCICYRDPEAKWRHYRVETGVKTKAGKEEVVYYHYNPCLMATHVKHSPYKEEVRGKLNPIKHSKRK